jgi:glycosyltransferase involved in cell wall biosynthesis
LINLLVDGVLLSAPSSLRGLGTYIRAVIEGLATTPGFSVEVLSTSTLSTPGNVNQRIVHRRLPPFANFYEQSVRLPGDIDKSDADVFHSPALDPPRRLTMRWVQTLHDVIPLVFAHRKHAVRRLMWRTRGARMRQADRVIAVSRYTADTGVRLLGIDPSRIEVVHHGVDPTFRPPHTRAQDGRPFVLFVGGYGPHKGFSEAFDVIRRLETGGLPHRLSVVGHMPSRAATRLAAEGGDRVDVLGYVSDRDLRTLYQQADLLAMTSRCEGFGLPVLEAMASGTPVVAFDNTALPEVVGEAGTLVRDGDVAAFAATGTCGPTVRPPVLNALPSSRGSDRSSNTLMCFGPWRAEHRDATCGDRTPNRAPVVSAPWMPLGCGRPTGRSSRS